MKPAIITCLHGPRITIRRNAAIEGLADALRSPGRRQGAANYGDDALCAAMETPATMESLVSALRDGAPSVSPFGDALSQAVAEHKAEGLRQLPWTIIAPPFLDMSNYGCPHVKGTLRYWMSLKVPPGLDMNRARVKSYPNAQAAADDAAGRVIVLQPGFEEVAPLVRADAKAIPFQMDLFRTILERIRTHDTIIFDDDDCANVVLKMTPQVMEVALIDAFISFGIQHNLMSGNIPF